MTRVNARLVLKAKVKMIGLELVLRSNFEVRVGIYC